MPDSQDRVLHLRRMLARPRGARAESARPEIESVGGTPPPAHPDDILSELDAILEHMPADEIGNEADFRKAWQTLIEHGEPALRKLAQPLSASGSDLSGDHVASLEAIVITDGTRPSFLLRNSGKFDHQHPFLGGWHDDMIAFAPTLERAASCVGRIQPASGNSSNFNGTGTLVDRDKGLVLTNFHVVEAARWQSGVAMTQNGNVLQVTGDWQIEFDAETQSAGHNRFRVKEVRLPDGVGAGFSGLDAAVLRIEPLDPAESRLPDHAHPLSADPDYANGVSTTLVTIGFPGEPEAITPAGATIDWNFVIKTLFGNRFGVKRVAPGKFMKSPGSVVGDPSGRALSHDATTFGGASGSLVLAWKDQDAPAFGLHFSGATLSSNNAVSIHKAAEALRKIGVPIA